MLYSVSPFDSLSHLSQSIYYLIECVIITDFGPSFSWIASATYRVSVTSLKKLLRRPRRSHQTHETAHGSHLTWDKDILRFSLANKHLHIHMLRIFAIIPVTIADAVLH